MLSKPQPESFEDFSHRFQLAQLLPKEKKGIIFIGNTRAGKTTLSCAAAGSPIKIKYMSKLQLTFLEPSDQKYKLLVKDTNQSVTETPNFFKNKEIAIVDMPGYADSSRFKQLINFHYIKTMVTNVQEISFFIVLTLSYGDGKYQLQGAQRRMLQNFAETFPQCKGCVSIIINRVQHNNTGNNHNEADAIKGAFRNLLNQPQNTIIRQHFSKNAVSKIHVFFRPPYKDKNNQPWEDVHPTLSQQISQICFTQNTNFLKMKNINADIKFFKEGDSIQNQKLMKMLSDLLKQQSARAKEVIKSYQQIIFFLIKGFVENRLKDQADDIQQVLDILLKKDIKVKRDQDRVIDIQPYKSYLTMIQSRLIKLYLTLAELDVKNVPFKDKIQKENFIISTVNNVMGQLIWIIHQAYPNKAQLLKKVKAMHNYLIRRFQQSFFIQKLLENPLESLQGLREFVQHSIYQLPQEINKFQKATDQILNNFYKLTEGVLNLNLKTKFGNNFSAQTRQQLIQTLEKIRILNHKNIITKDQKKSNIINQRVIQKIEQVQLYFTLIFVPNKPEQIKNSINNLLMGYYLAKTKQNKFKFALKIANSFAKSEQKQHAIALFLHLEIFEQALRLVDLILDPKKVEPKKTEIVLKWYLQMADFFKNKKKIYYFERCIQKAKTMCLQDLQMLINLQRIKQQGLQTISQLQNKDISMLKKQNSGQKILQFWQWDKIDEEIQFLKVLCKLQNKKKDWKVIGAKFRQ